MGDYEPIGHVFSTGEICQFSQNAFAKFLIIQPPRQTDISVNKGRS